MDREHRQLQDIRSLLRAAKVDQLQSRDAVGLAARKLLWIWGAVRLWSELAPPWEQIQV